MADQITFPDKFDFATRFVDRVFGDLEKCEAIPDVKKLALYALRRQATDGACKESAPYMWNVTERFKHSAWTQLGTMSPFEAMFQYANLLDDIHPDWLEQQYAHETDRGEDGAATDASASVDDVPAPPVLAEGSSGRLDGTPAGTPTSAGGAPQAPPQHSSTSGELDEALRWHPNAFDETGLKGDVTADNVRVLVSEVLRLRQLLAENGIDPSPPASAAHHTTSSCASSTAPSTRPRARGAPGRLTSRPRIARPAGPSRGTPRPAGAVDPEVQHAPPTAGPPGDRSFVSPQRNLPPGAPRLGWMQWLGLASTPPPAKAGESVPV